MTGLVTHIEAFFLAQEKKIQTRILSTPVGELWAGHRLAHFLARAKRMAATRMERRLIDRLKEPSCQFWKKRSPYRN